MASIEYNESIRGSVTSGASVNGNVCDKKSIVSTANISNGTNDYEQLLNIPSIESVQLKGNKTFEELGMSEVSNVEIDELFKRIFY